jgi:hypothetical protein
MAAAPKSFWQRLRIYFRRFRIAVWLLVFFVIAAALWLNVVGLPGFIKTPLLEKLRVRGIELQFTNLRLSWYRGFVAYNVRFGRPDRPDAPQFSARRVELPFSGVALRHFDFSVSGLVLSDGELKFPINETNQPARELRLENVKAAVSFLPNDEWRLDNFQARFAGAEIFLNGAMTHASAARDWAFLHPGPAPEPGAPGSPEQLRATLRQLADTLDQLKFSQPPGLRLSVYGDARDLRGFKIAASVIAADAATPWGLFGQTRLTVRSAGFSQATNSSAPELTFVRVQTQIDGGDLDLSATLDVATRAVQFLGVSDFDIQKIRPLLSAKADHWLGQFAWEKPPHIVAHGGLILPPWTNRPTDWRAEIVPTLRLGGEFKVGRAKFRDLPVLAAQSHVAYSNSVWRLPDLVVTRPEGKLRAAHWTDEDTRNYYWHIQGPFDLKVVRPFLEPAERHGLELLGLTTPPDLDVEVWGRWLEHELIGFKGGVVLSNFSFRGETGTSLHTAFAYTNLQLQIFHPEIIRADRYARADGVAVDFADKMVYITNGVGNIDPMIATRAIGPKTAEAIEPYHFLTPPLTHVYGSVSTETARRADLHFTVDGGPFRWLKFNATHVAGDVHWLNETLLITNIQADFYGGKLSGWTDFNFHVEHGNDFRFDIMFDHAKLGPLIGDLTQNTNQLEGLLTGWINVPRANTADWKLMAGTGHMQLRDGLLWEIPVFGVFAPVLNTMWPNLGSGRASEGSADFVITNGAVRSDNLELRSPAMRMQYRGSVDFASQLNARVEAELLRNTPVLGPLVSTVFWPITKALEYKVTGSLGAPQIEPLYIPKVFLVPFHPIQSVRDLFSAKPAPSTNAPPKFLDLTPDAP